MHRGYFNATLTLDCVDYYGMGCVDLVCLPQMTLRLCFNLSANFEDSTPETTAGVCSCLVRSEKLSRRKILNGHFLIGRHVKQR